MRGGNVMVGGFRCITFTIMVMASFTKSWNTARLR